MHVVDTYYANIYAGLREGYDGVESPIEQVFRICQRYCNEIGLGLTVTPTTFCYTHGRENGVIVGLINYPRFPSDKETLRRRALHLAERLRVGLKQHRVSVVFPDETIMLSEKEL